MESDTPRKADGDFSFMTQRNSSMNATALKIQLDQLKGVDLGSAKQNFVLVHATPAGAFADYGKPRNVADNFKMLAAAAAEAGLTGIFFDSECYLGDAWNPSQVCPESCPTPCLPAAPHYSGPGCPDSCLVPCRAEANAAGETVLKSILSAWPEAQVLGTFGPWVSTAESQQHVSFLPNWAKENPIIGSFVVGWMQALQQHRAMPTSTHASKALVLDGAECYGFRNLSDVLEMKQWMKEGMADTDIVPPDLKQAFPSLETVSPGVYDFPGVYRGRGPGTPSMWEGDLVASLTGMDPDGLTWAYSEKYDWFGLGMHATGKQPVPKAWLDATKAAMKRAHKSDDDDVVSVRDDASIEGTAVVAPGATCALSPVDAMVQITPWAATPPIAMNKPVAAARGELVHAQALLTGSGSSPVTAQIDARGTIGAPVTVRQMAYSDLNVTFGAGRPAGLYPSVLVPLQAGNTTYEAHGHQPVVLWLSVRVPQTTSPGLHPVTLKVSGGACTAPVEATIEFLVSRFIMPLPGHRSQTTEASFQVNGIAKFGPPGSGRPTPETVMAYFRSMTAQGVDAFIFWEHGGWDQMPWAPSYRFNKEKTVVELNSTMHQQWWPHVLNLTGPTTRWRMPFSDRVDQHNLVRTDTNWTFVDHAGNKFQVPVFSGTGELNPTFERMFKALFSVVTKYLQSNGWSEHGSWVAVVDEPSWWDHETVLNTIALARLYRSISPSVKVYQTRWPDAGYGKGFPANCKPLLDLVDEWCVHVIQWVGPGVPAEMAQAKADKKAAGKPPLLLTVYDNGVPITEAPNERARFQALDVWRSNGTLDGTLSWYSVDTYVHDPWLNPYPGGHPNPKPAGYGCKSPLISTSHVRCHPHCLVLTPLACSLLPTLSASPLRRTVATSTKRAHQHYVGTLGVCRVGHARCGVAGRGVPIRSATSAAPV